VNSRGLSAALFIVSVLLAMLVLAGCGGGEQSGSGSQDGGGSDAKREQQGAGAANQGGPQLKIAVGTIVATDPESKPNGKIILRPTAQVQGGERMIFKVAKNAEITLEDKGAKLADLKKGQQAQIEYSVVKVVNKDTDKTRNVNRARAVRAFIEPEGNRGG
jgi:hypothetical protein